MPAEIYWRRRLLALALLIGLVWVVLRLFGGDDQPEAATPAAVATTAAPVPSTVQPQGDTVQVTLVSAGRACDPQKIRLTPTVVSGQFTKGTVEIGLVVSSTEKTACTLAPQDADIVAVISANKTPIWDSTVCRSSLLDDPVALSPRWASFVTATWSGRGSGGTCSAREGYATPGRYIVQVGTFGGEPGKTTFTLKPRPAPKQTKSTPTASTKTPSSKTPSTKSTAEPNG